MTKQEYLINLLMEESAEIILIASKIKRFGLHEVYDDGHGNQKSNLERMLIEVSDLLTVFTMLGEEKLLDLPPEKDKLYDPEVLFQEKKLKS